MRRLNERMQRAIAQLSRAHARQAAQLQSWGERTRSPVVVTVPPANQWLTQDMDGYIGVLWSANVNVESVKRGEALWTFHDYPHVEAVERASPAERAGIQVGDMILAFDGKDLRAGKIPMNAVLRPGNTVNIRLNRANRTRSVSVRVEPRPRATVRQRTPRPSAPEAPADVVVIEPGLIRTNFSQTAIGTIDHDSESPYAKLQAHVSAKGVFASHAFLTGAKIITRVSALNS